MVSDDAVVEGFDESEVLRQLLGQGQILESSGATLSKEQEVKVTLSFICHIISFFAFHFRLFKMLIQNT